MKDAAVPRLPKAWLQLLQSVVHGYPQDRAHWW